MPDCHNETMKLIQSLHRDNYNLKSTYPLVKVGDNLINGKMLIKVPQKLLPC